MVSRVLRYVPPQSQVHSDFWYDFAGVGHSITASTPRQLVPLIVYDFYRVFIPLMVSYVVRRLLCIPKLNPVRCPLDVCWEVVAHTRVEAEELLSVEHGGDCGHFVGCIGLGRCFRFVLVWLLRLCQQQLVGPLAARVGGC